MEGGLLWRHNVWPTCHYVVGDGTGTELVLSQGGEKNVHQSLRVFITLCVQDQVYRSVDLVGLGTSYSSFGLTIPIRMTNDAYVYSPKPYIIVCGLSLEIANTLSMAAVILAMLIGLARVFLSMRGPGTPAG